MGTVLLAAASRIKGWALAALAVLAAFGAVFLVGRSKGKAAAQRDALVDKVRADNAALQHTVDAIKERNDVQINVDRQPDGTSLERLRNRWSR